MLRPPFVRMTKTETVLEMLSRSLWFRKLQISFAHRLQLETVDGGDYNPAVRNSQLHGENRARRKSSPALRVGSPCVDNRCVPQSTWEARIARAEALARQHPFAAEILSFYAQVARFQEGLHRSLETDLAPEDPAADLPRELAGSFVTFLSSVEKRGPTRLAETAQELSRAGAESLSNLLHTCWSRADLSPSQPPEFLARAFLQPRAVLIRARSGAQWNSYTQSLCPFCGRKPGAGILRPRGDGGQRSLLCSFCLAEWEFRRIVCAGCGEEDHHKLPVYSASDFDYIRVECCDRCKQYMKTVDLTRNGLADPLVDEIAAAPLDLWAREQGYSKLELNLVGM